MDVMSALYPVPTVVVGVDGSKAATNAVQWAVDEAVSRDIPLRLVYVIDPLDSSGARAHEGRLSAARTALHDGQQAAESTGESVKVETEILWGKPLTKLMEESRSAAMVCVGSIGLNHACHGGGSVAAALAGSALCPVAVFRGPVGRPTQAGSVVAEVDNDVVLRHAFEEARLRGVRLRAISLSRAGAPGRQRHDVGDGNRLAQARLARRIARWTRLYPDVQVESAIVRGSVERHLGATDQLLVTDSHACHDLCRAYHAGCSVLAIRCSHL
jgi:nucleotide-binding universal stress UspA family protein